MNVPLLLLAHELRTLFRTRRVLALLALYLGVGVLGGFGYVKVVQLGREAAMEAAMERGASEAEARQAVEAAAGPMREQVLELAVGTGAEGVDVASSLTTSLVLPIFFWCSLAFLPLLILLTSFDHVSTELADRSLRYSVLRASRTEVLVGKVGAHLLVFCVLSAVCSVALVSMAAALIDGISVWESAPGLVRVWLLLLPYAACYLAISTFASCSTPKPFFALLLALAITIALRVTGGVATMFDPGGPMALWRVLQYASPAYYHDGLWLAGWARPTLSAAAYCAFAAVFLTLSRVVLRRRDL